MRKRMVEHPQLFVQALNESAAQDRIEQMRVPNSIGRRRPAFSPFAPPSSK
jgi:hypothetical protein